MNKIILALIDYNGRFGSKHFDHPYRSGMEKLKLKSLFKAKGYDLTFEHFYKIDPINIARNGQAVIYTSAEDIGYRYKSYVEDIIFSLELAGCRVIPEFKYLRANNNKVFMEYLRQLLLAEFPLKTQSFGSDIELQNGMENITFPSVLKASAGASGKGVSLVVDQDDLIRKMKKMNQRSGRREALKDYLRIYKHKGYQREPLYRSKFIVQDFIPGLKNDWKVYFFGHRLYIFKRPIQKGRDIRASGGGYDNYYYGEEAEAPEGLFDFAHTIYKKLNVPHISIDIAYDGENFYLIEFQLLYFGTAGIPYSKGYFEKIKDDWVFTAEKLEVEEAYTDSIIQFLSME